MKTQHSHAAPLTVSPTPHKPFARFRALFRTVAVLGFFLVAVPLHAAADSCKPLLNSFATSLQQGGVFVEFVHTTNYQANGLWMTGHSSGYLHPATTGPLLSGEGFRYWDNGSTELLTVEFYANGTVRFNGQYGPYPTTCYGGKFLVVNTWDSFEVFTFLKGPIIIF